MKSRIGLAFCLRFARSAVICRALLTTSSLRRLNEINHTISGGTGGFRRLLGCLRGVSWGCRSFFRGVQGGLRSHFKGSCRLFRRSQKYFEESQGISGGITESFRERFTSSRGSVFQGAFQRVSRAYQRVSGGLQGVSGSFRGVLGGFKGYKEFSGAFLEVSGEFLGVRYPKVGSRGSSI